MPLTNLQAALLELTAADLRDEPVAPNPQATFDPSKALIKKIINKLTKGWKYHQIRDWLADKVTSGNPDGYTLTKGEVQEIDRARLARLAELGG